VALFAVPHPCFSRVFCDVFTANGEVAEWLKAAVCCEGGGLLNRKPFRAVSPHITPY
jgi:hypothetical protein